MTTLYVVLPGDIDDPANPSGGNLYDRRVCDGLAAAGWTVREHKVRGAWPRPDPAARDELAALLAGWPDGALVLIDGLVASAVPEVLAGPAGRLRLAVLVHLPLGEDDPQARAGEYTVLSAASALIATSDWSRRRLLELYPLDPARVYAAAPGVDPAAEVVGTPAGVRLLCVAAVAPHKGHDVLVEALSTVADQPWSCAFVGPLTRDPDFVHTLRRRTRQAGLSGRIQFAGARTRAGLDAAYARADLLVVASRGETYGMVVTEALARAVPVLATDTGGVTEALGAARDGGRPGLLVPPGDPAALAGGLRRWLGRPELRAQLRRRARDRRATLTGWSTTSTYISSVLNEILAG